MAAKPTLHQKFIDEESHALASENKKSASSSKLIRDAQKESQQEALKMSDEEIAEEVAKLKKKPSEGDDEVEIDPADFKYKLDKAQKKEFFATLTPDQQAAVKAWHADVDYLANVPVPKPHRAQTAYFTFGADVREKLKKDNIKLGVTELANRIKDDWTKLGAAGQEKYEKLREKQIQQYQTINASRALLKEAQKAALKFYSKIIGPVPNPARAESNENHGVAWTAHLKERHIKKMIVDTPGWEGSASKDVVRVVSAATEALIVWFGQQLAARAVRAKRKTVSGPLLKAFSTEEPHASYLSRVPAIKDIKIEAEKEKEEKPKKEKAPKEEKPKKEKVPKEPKKDAAAGSMKKFLKADGAKKDASAFEDEGDAEEKKPQGPKKRKQAPAAEADDEEPVVKSPVKKQKGNKADKAAKQ